MDGGLGCSSDGSGGGLWAGPLCGEALPSIGGGISILWHISKILDGARLGQWWYQDIGKERSAGQTTTRWRHVLLSDGELVHWEEEAAHAKLKIDR
jgi:hypothetical protein